MKAILYSNRARSAVFNRLGTNAGLLEIDNALKIQFRKICLCLNGRFLNTGIFYQFQNFLLILEDWACQNIIANQILSNFVEWKYPVKQSILKDGMEALKARMVLIFHLGFVWSPGV